MAIEMQSIPSPNEIKETSQADDLFERVYGDLIELLARGGGPEAIIAFRSSEKAQNRAYDLVYRQRVGALTAQETRELEAYTEREHFVRLAKARAHLLIMEASAELNQVVGIKA